MPETRERLRVLAADALGAEAEAFRLARMDDDLSVSLAAGADEIAAAAAERFGEVCLPEVVLSLLADAERLDWLDQQEGMSLGTTIGGGHSLRYDYDQWQYGASIREVIDAARAALTPESR
jgi:hypothetical protein